MRGRSPWRWWRSSSTPDRAARLCDKQEPRGTKVLRGSVWYKQACKPGSVIQDSHLSSRAVADAIKPPPERGRASLLRSHGVAPDRVYSDAPFPGIGRALTSAFPPLPRRHKLHIPLFAASGKARSFRCASSPQKSTAFLGTPYGDMEPRRYISVALFLGSPPAGVTRYPRPAEPGLSSRVGLSPRPRGCPAYLQGILYPIPPRLSNPRFRGGGGLFPLQ